ncbi:hypothetical protein [Mycobacterium mantenii]|uniref:hypothetical protein n=1 Tax=Mycobacterium mantenii TaxID=560555 RepID=UPI001041FDC4|nr:hypothetical protein [Mycobacterium mantenii]
MTMLPAVDAEIHGELAELGNRTPTVRKSPNYSSIYESVVDPTSRIRMFVIGSFYGDSVEMWQKFLHPDSLIVGIDVDAKLVKVADSQGIRVRIGGEQTISSLSETAAEFGPFDVILDTGSHTSSHMVDCFRCLFVSALSDGGAYIVERVDCDYRKFYRDSPVSFIDLVRALIDAMNSKFITSGTSLRGSNPDNVLEVSVPTVTPTLGSIEIYESIVIVRRTTPDLTQTSFSHH